MSKRVLLLRTCGPDGEAYEDFRWPLEIGAVVRPAKWDPNPERDCGDALHGLLGGQGDGSLLNWSENAKWLVVSADADDVLPARAGKNRFREGRVEFVGDRKGATDYLMERGCLAVVGSLVTAGDWGTATAGYRGTATAGDWGTATAGYEGTATAGYRGTATAGDRGTATAGDWGTATAGYRGTATAGYRGTATAGDRGTATAGYEGTATAGDWGTIEVLRWDGARYRRVVGYIGEDGIKSGVAYRVSADGKSLVEAK